MNHFIPALASSTASRAYQNILLLGNRWDQDYGLNKTTRNCHDEISIPACFLLPDVHKLSYPQFWGVARCEFCRGFQHWHSL